MIILIAIAALLVLVFVGLWNYARWNYGKLEKMGIPVVEYTNPILGSLRALNENPGGPQDVQWMRKYGQIFGVYEGREPQVMICVPKLVRLICVKDHDSFSGKREHDHGDPVVNDLPEFLSGEKWKIVRSLSTPAFTSAKMRMMNLPMREAIQDFVADIKELIRKGNGMAKKYPIDQSIHTMLTDLIGRAMFSVQVGDRTSQNNGFTQIITELNTPPEEEPSTFSQEISTYSHAFPFLKTLFPDTSFNPAPITKFTNLLKHMMAERKRSGQKRNDLIDMFQEWWDKLDTPEFTSAKITEATLISQAISFFAAGQDQISTMVATLIYQMIKDPELNRRIYSELDEALAKYNGKLEQEHLTELTLMNSCIQECLRLHTVFHRLERVCTKDWKNSEYNLTIKKGTVVLLPIWALNRNQGYNERPDEFWPERFVPENKDKVNPYSSTSFGHGPRICTGKRFAMEAIPLLLVYMLKEFKFVGREDTQIKLVPGGTVLTPHEPIYVDVVERR